MRFHPFFVFIFILQFCSKMAVAQQLRGDDDPCSNRQTVSEGQFLYLTQGEQLINFKFVPEEFQYGVGNGIWTIVEQGTNDTFLVWADETPLVFDSMMNAICILTHDSLMYSPNGEIITHHSEDHYKKCYSKSTIFKGVLTFLVDFDSITSGGQCTFTGYYFMDFKSWGKPFENPYILSRDSFNNRIADLKKSPFHCDKDPRQFGTFKDSISGDMLKVEFQYHSTKNMATFYYLKKGSKKWTNISPKYPNAFGNKRLSPFFPNDPKHKLFPGEVPQFIFMNNGQWISTGSTSNKNYYPDGKLPKGVKYDPGIPFKSFKRIQL